MKSEPSASFLAEVRTAVPLRAEQRKKLQEALSKAVGKDVELKVIVDPSVIEAQAPGFRSLVVGRHVEVHPGGAVNGGTAAPSQQSVFRPVPGLGRADTPVDRLYLAGASAHPGGGVHGASGANAGAKNGDRAAPRPGDHRGLVLARRRLYRHLPASTGRGSSPHFGYR